MSDFHFIYEKSYGCEINISSIQAKYMTMNANTKVRNILILPVCIFIA